MRNLVALMRFYTQLVDKYKENNLEMIKLKHNHRLMVQTGASSLLRMIHSNKLLKLIQLKGKDQLTN